MRLNVQNVTGAVHVNEPEKSMQNIHAHVYNFGVRVGHKTHTLRHIFVYCARAVLTFAIVRNRKSSAICALWSRYICVYASKHIESCRRAQCHLLLNAFVRGTGIERCRAGACKVIYSDDVLCVCVFECASDLG